MQPMKRALESAEFPQAKKSRLNREKQTTEQSILALFKKITEVPPDKLLNQGQLLLENFGPSFIELGSSTEKGKFLTKICMIAAFLSDGKKTLVKDILPFGSYKFQSIGPFLITTLQSLLRNEISVRVAPDYNTSYFLQSENLHSDSHTFFYQGRALFIKSKYSLELFSFDGKEMKVSPNALDLNERHPLFINDNTFGFNSHIDLDYEKNSVTLYYTSSETLIQEKIDFALSANYMEIIRSLGTQDGTSSIHSTKEGLYFFKRWRPHSFYFLLPKNEVIETSKKIWHFLALGPCFTSRPPIFRDEAIYSLSVVETEEGEKRSLVVYSLPYGGKEWQEKLFNLENLNNLFFYLNYSISFGPYIAFPAFLGSECALFFYHTEKKSLDCHYLPIDSSNTIREIVSLHSEKTHLILVLREEFLIGEEGNYDTKPFSYVISRVPTFWSKNLGEGFYKEGKIIKGEVIHSEEKGDKIQLSLDAYEYSTST